MFNKSGICSFIDKYFRQAVNLIFEFYNKTMIFIMGSVKKNIVIRSGFLWIFVLKNQFMMMMTQYMKILISDREKKDA